MVSYHNMGKDGRSLIGSCLQKDGGGVASVERTINNQLNSS